MSDLTIGRIEQLTHTPGPWTVRSGLVYGPNDARVAAFEGLANARLIAAAPELFAIAKTIVLICESGDTNLAQLACDDNSPLVGEARAVIAKVEGP